MWISGSEALGLASDVWGSLERFSFGGEGGACVVLFLAVSLSVPPQSRSVPSSQHGSSADISGWIRRISVSPDARLNPDLLDDFDPSTATQPFSEHPRPSPLTEHRTNPSERLRGRYFSSLFETSARQLLSRALES